MFIVKASIKRQQSLQAINQNKAAHTEHLFK